MFKPRPQKIERILLYAEGNFSFTEALCRQLAANTTLKEHPITYELVATSFDEYKPENLEEIKARIYREIEKINPELKANFNIVLLDKVDATKKDERIKGPFNQIICNFPTPFYIVRLPVDKMFLQIRQSNLLHLDGQIQIRYWLDEDGTYHAAYKLADAQKKNYLELTTREIVDLKELQQLGYEHTTHTGEKGQIKWLPLVATYKYNKAIRKGKIPPDAKELEQEKYQEESDSEELPNDPMPERGGNKNYLSEYSNLKINYSGTVIRRREHLKVKYDQDRDKYSALEIGKLIQKKDYREADRRLTLIMEAGDEVLVNFFVDKNYNSLVVKRIEFAYKQFAGKKPSEENLKAYHTFGWYTKLKILSGVKLPELLIEEKKSHFTWK